MFTKAFSFFLLPALAAAQIYGPPPGPDTPTATTPAVVPTAPANTPGQMNVNVAFGGGFVFSPANITAPVGTVVTFFFPNAGVAHSVTQSSFQNPCTYLAASGNSSAGFDSGLQTAVTFSINITNTDPIWYFCKQVTHCGIGMVGSINAPATGNTFDAFQAAAKAIGPNEQTTPDNGPVTGGVNGIATATPVSDLNGIPGSGSGSSGSTGGAVGLAASGAVALLSAAALGLLI